MRLHLRTVTEEEARRTFPDRILSHAQLEYNAAGVIITSEAGTRFGYFMWNSRSPQPIPGTPGEKDGILFVDDPAREHAADEEGCCGDHFLEAPCNFLEMAGAASKLLGQ